MLLLLFKTYKSSNNLVKKNELIESLRIASELPSESTHGDDMKAMVLSNIQTILDFYLSIIPSADFEIIKKIEEQIFWLKRSFTKEQFSKLSNIESSIHSNEDYRLYRLFVGYDHDYNKDFDFKKAEEHRIQRIKEIIDEINKAI